jgi:FixJ family two-component response regulator
VMFMSGYADADAFAGGNLSEATVFLEKPFTFAHLKERVHALVQG